MPHPQNPQTAAAPPDQALSQLSQKIGGPILVIKSDIDPECRRAVVRRLAAVAQQERLTLLLESPGGSIEDAFWIVKAIRQRCETLDVIIIGAAKSAATLIALAADRILLGTFGELGPLDAQLHDFSGGARRKSPLETMRGLEFLRDHYLETFNLVMDILATEYGIDSAHALELVPSVLSPMTAPLYQLVDYRELGDALRILSISEAYARGVIRRWGTVGNNESIDNIVPKLVWGYPDHGHIIDLAEARSLGLNNSKALDSELEYLCGSVMASQSGQIVKLYDSGPITPQESTGAENGKQSANCGNK